MKSEIFAEIYGRYAALIKKSVVAQTNNGELADEICQQTFFALYKNMDNVEEAMVKAWLFQTARHFLVDYWRKVSTRRELPVDEESVGYGDAAFPMDLEKQCADRDFIRRLMEDLQRINQHWYDVIDCICIREMSHQETAEHLGITPVMLRARLYRAKCFLQERYGSEYP